MTAREEFELEYDCSMLALDSSGDYVEKNSNSAWEYEICINRNTAWKAWQARGVRIKELEEKLKDAEDAAWNNYKAVETITDYLIENDWLEITVEGDGKEAALNIINSVQKQIKSLGSKLTIAVDALDSIASDIDTWHSDKAIEALNKIKGDEMGASGGLLEMKDQEIAILRQQVAELTAKNKALEVENHALWRGTPSDRTPEKNDTKNYHIEWCSANVKIAELTAKLEESERYGVAISEKLRRLWEID